jgi:Fuc2NAc and GlcNAc transferase
LLPQLIRYGVLDQPNARSGHPVATPRGGGLAVAIVTLSAWLILDFAVAPSPLTTPLLVVIGAGFAALGWADDRRSRSVWSRLAVQTVLALAFAFGQSSAGAAGWALGLAALIIWHVNAFNFMDGADGFAPSQALLFSLGVCLLLLANGTPDRAYSAAAVAGASAGFLRWNWAPARVFLGDSGSYFLGFALVALAVMAHRRGVNWMALACLAAPVVVDTSLTLSVRAAGGLRVWQAHREHAYQRLLARGWSAPRLATALVVLHLACLWPAAWLATTSAYGVPALIFANGLLAIIWLRARGMH